MILFGENKTNTQIAIKLDGVTSERVNEIKFLVMTIAKQICWKSHIKYVQTKVSRSIAVLNKAKMVFDKNHKITQPSLLFTSSSIFTLLCRGVGK